MLLLFVAKFPTSYADRAYCQSRLGLHHPPLPHHTGSFDPKAPLNTHLRLNQSLVPLYYSRLPVKLAHLALRRPEAANQT